jgi:coproporphyrinogen III oxidase-like Fe-S oxidoreductase
LADLPTAAKDEVLRAWEASRRLYGLESRGQPKPPWERRGFGLGGEEAWKLLRGLAGGRPAQPCSIYVHVPFCEARCGFCDCYALATRAGHPLHAAYVQRLRLDLRLWSQEAGLSGWPVTTVHFGGGTPNHLEPKLLAALVETVRAEFRTTPETEWAIESPARLMGGPGLDLLWGLGFRRLHVGLQTLEDPLRQRLGRQGAARQALERIAGGLARGFVTTADLLYGLPGQTAKGFFDGLGQLDRLGIHGLSLYRLNESSRNQMFRRRFQHRPGLARDFAMFVAADGLLSNSGFGKNHFCHYAKAPDLNLYYNHARRGEGLLAVGASADGTFGGLAYRNRRLGQSFLDLGRQSPPLQGGVEERGQADRRAVARHLITGSVPKSLIGGRDLADAFERWRACLLVREKPGDPSQLQLTGTGSWHVSALLDELEPGPG